MYYVRHKLSLGITVQKCIILHLDTKKVFSENHFDYF